MEPRRGMKEKLAATLVDGENNLRNVIEAWFTPLEFPTNDEIESAKKSADLFLENLANLTLATE